MGNSLSFSWHLYEEEPIKVDFVNCTDCPRHIRISLGNNTIFITGVKLAKSFRANLNSALAQAILDYEEAEKKL